MSGEYELILMLDPAVPDERREEIAGGAKERIEARGSLRHSDAWGMRKLAYEIKQRTEADYRFYRFQAEPELLDDLDHTLKITDGILRFRVFKVDPRAPLIEPPTGLTFGGASREGRGGRRDDRGSRREGSRGAPAAAAEESPGAPEAPVAPETPAEPEPGPSEPGEAPAEPEETPAEPAPEEPAPAAEAESAAEPAER